jgi:asparagine synthase (glutamine-hydrolysing)
MAESMRHRGPDDDGSLIDGSFGMTMRRLSIIDLETGAQPVSSEDGSVSVIFNGEIYNYVELRASLESKGHRFSTKSDTEVIVHLYEQYGAALATELIGMFAIAVWDSKLRKLILIRDRLGVKPLYWTRRGDELIFGSEIKCLLAASDIPPDIDSRALDAYLSCQYFPFDTTIYSTVRKLRAGHIMTIENNRHSIERYWEIKFPDDPLDISEKEAVKRFTELFYISVKRRLISDVPLGLFLSGGIDSASVLAAMSEISGSSFKTFTLGFGEEAPGYSEFESSRVSASFWGADNNERIASATDICDNIDRILHHFDEPFGGGLHTWFLSEFSSPHIKVALTGIGADELFGGYQRQKRLSLIRVFKTLPLSIRKTTVSLASYSSLRNNAGKLNRLASSSDRDIYYEWISIADESLKRTLYNPVFHSERSHDSLGGWAASIFGSDMPSKTDDLISFLELKTTLPDDFLNYTDRMTMGWGLEAREPFLDHQLVEFAVSLSMNLKVKNGESKYILKKAMSDKLPAKIVNRKKQPFHLPIGIWLRNELRPLIEKTLCASELASEKYFEPAALRKLVDDHIAGSSDNGWILWSLFLVEHWMKKNT